MGTIKGKPPGYFKFLLAMDSETTGFEYNAVNPATGYQSISWGFVVADSETLKPVDKLYVEIKWDGKSKWSKQAEAVHGLTKEHLEEHGLTSEEAAEEFFGMVLKYWSPESVIVPLGHNIGTFDLWFLREWLEPLGVMPKLSHRIVDTNSLGFVGFQSYNSDQLFELIGLPQRDPAKHNALDDAEYALAAARRFRTLFNTLIDG